MFGKEMSKVEIPRREMPGTKIWGMEMLQRMCQGVGQSKIIWQAAYNKKLSNSDIKKLFILDR